VKDIIASTLFTGASVWRAVGVGGVDVFGAEPEADHAGGDAAQDEEMFQEVEWDREALEWDFGG